MAENERSMHIFRERLSCRASCTEDDEQKNQSSCTPRRRATASRPRSGHRGSGGNGLCPFSPAFFVPQAAAVRRELIAQYDFTLYRPNSSLKSTRIRPASSNVFSARRSLCRSALSYAPGSLAYPAKGFAVRFVDHRIVHGAFFKNRSNSGGFSSIPSSIPDVSPESPQHGYARHTQPVPYQLFHQTFGIGEQTLHLSRDTASASLLIMK